VATETWKEENADRMRSYRTGWYQRNRTSAIAKSAERRKEYRERNKRIVQDAKAKACADCAVQYPYYVMHFDHLGDDKDGTINKMVFRPVSEAKLRTEMAKCEVVCANCHAERTHTRRAEQLNGEP